MIKLQMIGYLGKDAVESSYNGKSVLSFRVAQTERFKNQQGVPQERTTWVDCVMWERANLAPYLTQGTQVYLEGKPYAEAYNSNAGEAVGVMRLRVQHLQLLAGGRRQDDASKPTADTLADDALLEQPADDLPF
jgi:single-strand DNA-binding protein